MPFNLSAEVPEWAQAMTACIKTDVNDLVQLALSEMKTWIRKELREQMCAAHGTHGTSDMLRSAARSALKASPTLKPLAVSRWQKAKKEYCAARTFNRSVKQMLGNKLNAGERQARESAVSDTRRTKKGMSTLTGLFSTATFLSRYTETEVYKGWQSELQRILDGYMVRIAFLVVLFLNSLLIGMEVQQFCDMALNQLPEGTMSFELILLELLMCCLCTVEVGLRIAAEGVHYLSSYDWKWNVFDLVCLVLQQTDIVRMWVSGYKLSTFRFSPLRVFRLFRHLMLGNLSRHFRPFQALIRSIVNTLSWVLSACLILGAIVYVNALYLSQIVSSHLVEIKSRSSEELELIKYFGTLGRAVLSLYQCITGGIDWAAALEPLMIHIDPLLAVPFCLYVAFAVLALFNVITGVFVESVLQSTKKDIEQVLLNNMHTLFREKDGSYNRSKMSYDVFMQNLETQEMMDYLEAIDVNPSDATTVFHLIDTDGSGNVTPDEFFKGSLNLSGSARALDMAIVKQDTFQLAACTEKGFNILTTAICNIEDLTRQASSTMTNAVHSMENRMRTESSSNYFPGSTSKECFPPKSLEETPYKRLIGTDDVSSSFGCQHEDLSGVSTGQPSEKRCIQVVEATPEFLEDTIQVSSKRAETKVTCKASGKRNDKSLHINNMDTE